MDASSEASSETQSREEHKRRLLEVLESAGGSKGSLELSSLKGSVEDLQRLVDMSASPAPIRKETRVVDSSASFDVVSRSRWQM